jgi:aryl-alcohol dehydrogenase-like predicted oxidoreductase
MRFKLLGRSGLRVSEICLGTMTFGEEWGWGSTKEEARKVFDAYAKRGGNFLDTANRYTEGTSEKIVGELIAADRDHWVLATKYSFTMRPEDANFSGNHRKNMMQSVEASLRRLKTEVIDLYWLHGWDFTTGIDEVLRGFDDLVRSGKILYAGISDTPAWIVSSANTMADLRGWTPFVALQIEYSLIERTVEREFLPMARALDLAVTAWSPLGSGLLTGKYRTAADAGVPADRRITENHRRLTESNLRIAREVIDVAKGIGRTPAQVALAWMRRKQGVIIPIVGARRAEQLEDSLGCLDFELPEDTHQRLEMISRIPLGFPHEFLDSAPIREIVYGKAAEQIDFHR